MLKIDFLECGTCRRFGRRQFDVAPVHKIQSATVAWLRQFQRNGGSLRKYQVNPAIVEHHFFESYPLNYLTGIAGALARLPVIPLSKT